VLPNSRPRGFSGLKASPPRAPVRHLGAAVIAALSVFVFAAPAAHAAADVTHTQDQVLVSNFPVAIGSCVNSGNGEVILITGTLHNVTSLRSDDNGGVHVTTHTNLAGTSGVGTISGDTYRVTDTAGGFGQRLSLYFPSGSPPARTVTQSRDVRFISQGSAENLLLRFTFHQTINADGEVTVQDPRIEQICVG
jgi:hypothetical protein